ncbi:hypothetical protein L1049_026543 [Liquidambar formosana]|uniref:Uncharacterized protein n=1 Tax=Liquidambar formosana TaxID=63359 RepID=A0AAP0NDI3_LIQFO
MEMDFHNMNRKQLQALCKEHGLPANLKNVDMANKLALLLQEKAKPVTRGQSCLKNLIEIPSDNDYKDVPQKSKKVRFSPKNEMIEFVYLEDSDNEIPQPTKRATRSRSAKPVVNNSGFATENNANTKLSEEIMDNPVRVTRSRAQNLTEGDVVVVSSPPVERKKVRRGPKSRSMEAKRIDGVDDPPSVVELADNVDITDAHANEIRGSDDKILAGEGGNSKPGKLPRRSKRNATKTTESALLDGESGQIEMARRITRSRTQVVGEEASALEIGKVTGTTEFEIQKECEVVLRLKEPLRGLGRKASKRKSVAPQKEMVRSDGSLLLVRNETRKQMRNTLLEEEPSQIDVNVEILKENEMVSLANRPLRRSRRNTMMLKSTALAPEELRTHEIVGSIEPSQQLRESISVKEASVNEEHLRRSRRTASRSDSTVTANGMDGIANGAGKNKPQKRRRDPVLEEETSMTDCEPIIEDPPRRFTRNASKRESIAPAGLSRKAVENKQPQNRWTVQILEEEAPLSTSKSALNEPIVDAGATVAEASKRLIEPSHSKEVVIDSKKRRQGSWRKSSSMKRSSYMEVHPVISDVEEIKDLTTVDLEETLAPKSVKSLGVTTNQETESFVMESVVATENESFAMGNDKEDLLQGDTHKGDDDDQACWSPNRREDFNYDNLVELPVDGFLSAPQSDCVDKPAHLVDLGKELEAEELVLTGTHLHASGIVADDGAEDDKASVHSGQNLEELEEVNRCAEPIIHELVLEDHVSGCNANGGSKLNLENASEEAVSVSHVVTDEIAAENLVELPVDGFLSAQWSYCVDKPAHLVDSVKELEIEELVTGTHLHASGIVAEDGAEDDKASVHSGQNVEELEEANHCAEPIIHESVLEDHVSVCNASGGAKLNLENASEEAVSVSHVGTDEIAAVKVSEIQFTMSSHSILGMTPLTIIISPENQACGNGDKVISTCGHTLVIDNNEQEQEETQANSQYLVQPTMLGRSNTNDVEGEESSSYEIDIPNGTICRDETFVSKSRDGLNSQERTEEAMTAKENEPEEASYMIKSYPADGTKVNLDVEFVRVHSGGQVAKDDESGGTGKIFDNVAEEIVEKSTHGFSDGEGITPIISGKNYDRVDDPLVLICAPETSGIVDKDFPPCEYTAIKDNDEYGLEDQHEFQFSEPSANAIIPSKKEETSCYEAEMVDGTMFEGEEALASNGATGKFSQGKPEEVVGAKEGEHKGTAEIGSAFKGNLDVESTGVDDSIHAVSDESFTEYGIVVEDKESGGSKANCKILSEEGMAHILKFSVGAETSPGISEERERDIPENCEEVPGIHEIVAESHEVPAPSAVVKDTENKPARISQFSGESAPLTPIHTPESHDVSLFDGFHIGDKYSLSIDDDMQGQVFFIVQKGNQLKVPANDINPLERKDALLHEIENWVFDESSYGGADAVGEIMKATSVKRYQDFELGMEAINEVIVKGDGSTNVKDIFSEVLTQHSFDAGSGGKGLPKEVIALSPELVAKKLYEHEEEAIERNCSFDTDRDVSSSENNVLTEDKLNDEGMEGECKVEHYDHVVNNRNSELCPEFDLGDHNDCHKVVAQRNGNASSLAETNCKETEVSEEKTTVETIKITSERIKIIDKPEEEENGGTLQADCPVGLGQVVSEYRDEFAELNVNAPSVLGKNVLGEASEETSNEVAKEKLNFSALEITLNSKDAKDILMDVKSGTIPQLDNLVSIDLDDHEEQELEQSYFITSDEFMPGDGEAAGEKEKVGTMEGKFNFDVKDSGAMAIDVDTLPQITEKDFGNHLEEEKVAEVHDSDWDDHIYENSSVLADTASLATIKGMDMLEEVEKGRTLLPAGPVGLSQAVLDYGLEFSLMNVGAPYATDNMVCAEYEDSERISDGVAKTRLQPDEAKFGSQYNHKEEVIMESNMNITDNNADAERGYVDASPLVTQEDFGDHLVEEEVSNVNESDHDLVVDHICDNTGVAADEAGVVSMDEKGISENNEDGTLVTLQRFNSDGKWDKRNSAEVKLFTDTSCSTCELSSSNAAFPLLNVLLSYEEEYESDVYNQDVSNDAEEKEMKDKGNAPVVVDMPFHEDSEVTVEKNIEAKKGNNDFEDANNSSCVEENARVPQEVVGEHLGDHMGAVEEVAFLSGNECFSNKLLCDNRSMSNAEEIENSSRKFDDPDICDGHSKEFVDFVNLCDISSLKDEMGDDCSVISPISLSANHENGAAEFGVESCMFSSRKIDLYLAEGEEDKVKESNKGVSETTIICESNEDARKVKKNPIILQLVAEEEHGKEKHHMEEEVADLNGTHVAFSGEPISEDGVASMEENEMAITTRVCNDSKCNIQKSVEVENSCVSTHPEILTEAVKMGGTDHAASDETAAEGEPKDSTIENVTNVAMKDKKCEAMGEAIEPTEAILKPGFRVADLPPAFIDSAVGRGVAEDTKMRQAELEFTRKKNPDAKMDCGNSWSAKQMNSSMTKRKNIRTPSIFKTPKKLLHTVDMKENTPSIKGEPKGSITAVKSVTKRRALENLQ